MIKSHFLSFFLLLFCSEKMQSQDFPFYDNKNSENGLNMMLLKGKVKSVRQTTYTATDSLGTMKKEKKSETNCCTVNSDFMITFDEKGRTTKETYYNPPEKDVIMIHKYDDIKNSEVADQYESRKKPIFEYIYKYNNRGEIIQLNHTQFLYDENDPQNWSYVTTFKYDEKGNMIESEINAGNPVTPAIPAGKTGFKYDSKGNKTELHIYTKKNITNYKELYKTDDKGNLTEHDFYQVDSVTLDHKVTFKYDANKSIIEKKYFYPIAPKNSKNWAYKYEYDKNNNWIKRTDYENGKATLILERQFEYY